MLLPTSKTLLEHSAAWIGHLDGFDAYGIKSLMTHNT
jgi:hypothetical protein